MNQIRVYLDGLFMNVEKSSRAFEVKIDIHDHLIEKVNDLKNSGKSEEEAIGIVLSQIGGIDELIDEFGLQTKINEFEVSEKEDPHTNKDERNYYLLYIPAIAMFIFSPLFLILSGINGAKSFTFAFIWLFGSISVGVGLIIYASSQEKKSRTGMSKVNKLSPRQQQLSSAIYTLATVVFLIIGFTKGLWHIAWVTYLIAYVVLKFLGVHDDD